MRNAISVGGAAPGGPAGPGTRATTRPGRHPASVRGSIRWNSEARGTAGSGARANTCTHENTAVLTPMPIASEATTTALSTGAAASIRQPWRRSRSMRGSWKDETGPGAAER